MKSAEIRKAFLDYFASQGHRVVGSSPLIPRHDPTLLFTNAGMVQFKSVFLGEETRDYKRAASSQKCLRAGGKHSDLENVGHTSRHHTFFEMLGNFSFGDYFKREAIEFAWELLTGWYKLPQDRLWVTIYEDDDEAEGLWQEAVGVPGERIVRLGAKDNFWQMADTGPCGPCSEVLIDQGEGVGCGTPECRPGCDCDRYLELWNLVFMQFNRDGHGNLTPLPSPSIDTGMGLERITAVLQGKLNNFDSDLFSDVISSISSLTGAAYGKGPESDVSIRVIADHVRACAFLLADGLMPSNEGRGYVLRRIIRRAARHARLLGTSEPLLCRLLDPVAAAMGEAYPELGDEEERSAKILRIEEERFARTLEQGMRILDDVLDGLRASGERTIPGAEVFRLYDTFGFPLDLTRDIAQDSGFLMDEEGFNAALREQRERARASWVGEEEAIDSIYRELLSEAGPAEFVGYDSLEAQAAVNAILKDGKVVEELREGDRAEVFLDRTPFYGESGGQVGDTGTMTSEEVKLVVEDTKKPVEGLYAHRVRVKRGALKVWDKLTAKVDARRRKATVRNHTATHLLQAALRSVVGEHVKQAGSLVEPDRFRFDFTHFAALTPEEIEAVEDFVNEKIVENIRVEAREMEINEALARGAIALFGEKYGERVRVVEVPSVSIELCGGTHERATGETGAFAIVSEGSVASGIRRIEGLTGLRAFEHLRDRSRTLEEISAALKSDKPLEEVRRMQERLRELEREVEKSRASADRDLAAPIMEAARTVDGVKVVAGRVDGLDQKRLRGLADNVRDRIGSGVIVLASGLEDQASIVAMVTKDLAKKYHAGNILKAVAQAAGGRGGGKPDMAQGGTRELGKLDSALDKVYDIVRGNE
ncbi:MAG: alanine--tRNA ligase [Nitrospirota bacterium]|jgi:alanyl-tRNA synthetase